MALRINQHVDFFLNVLFHVCVREGGGRGCSRAHAQVGECSGVLKPRVFIQPRDCIKMADPAVLFLPTIENYQLFRELSLE